jgi:hypothetical protein
MSAMIEKSILIEEKRKEEIDRKTNVSKCPTCSSKRVERISGINKVGSAAMLGVFETGHTSKYYESEECRRWWDKATI